MAEIAGCIGLVWPFRDLGDEGCGPVKQRLAVFFDGGLYLPWLDVSAGVCDLNCDGNSDGRFFCKKIVLSIIVAAMFISVLSWFPSAEPKGIARFCITGVLCWFLFKGKNWARWVMAVLSALGGSIMVLATFSGHNGLEKSIALLAIAATYSASAALLIFSKSVASYFQPPT